MRIHGELTRDDYLKIAQTGLPTPIFNISIWLVGGLIILPLLRHQFNWVPITLFVAFYLVFALILLIPRLFPKLAERQFLRQKVNLGPFVIEMNADGIAFSSPTATFTERWAKYFRTYTVGPDYTILCEAGSEYHIFPKRWFTEEQYAQFQTYLRNSLGKPSR